MPTESLMPPRARFSTISPKTVANPFFDRPMLILSCICIIVSVAIFTLSMLDLGAPIFYLNPIFSALSIVFLFAALWLRHRHRRVRPVQNDMRNLHLPAYAIPSEVFAYLLAVGWLAPLSVSIVASIPEGPLASSLMKEFMAGNRVILVAQGIMAVVNFILLGSIAIFLSLERRRYDLSRDFALFKHFVIE